MPATPLLPLIGPQTPSNKSCTSVLDSMAWAENALSVIEKTVPPAELSNILVDRVISTSSAFSGIGTPETADKCITGGVQKFLNKHGMDGEPVKFRSSYVIESNKRAQQEQKMHVRRRGV